MSSFKDKMKQDIEGNKDVNASEGGSDWFKFKEGENRFRILTEPVILFEKFKVGICYTDCGYQGNAKYLAHILDRNDGKVKLAKIPYGIMENIGAMETDEDYNFSGFPMPYDVSINAVGAGTKEVKYTVLARPRKEMSPESLDLIKKLKSPAEIIEKMKAKKKEEHIKDGTWEREQARKADLKAQLEASRGEGGGKVEGAIEYPEEDINPDDIPF